MAGRPSKYKEEYAEQAEKVCTLFGADDKKLAKFFKVSRRTINSWKEEHLEFLHSIKRGKDVFDREHVEASLLERALGYKHGDIQFFAHKGVVEDERTIEKCYPPDTTALIFWLVNRSQIDEKTGIKRWQHVNKIEHSGPGGGPIDHSVTVTFVNPKPNK